MPVTTTPKNPNTPTPATPAAAAQAVAAAAQKKATDFANDQKNKAKPLAVQPTGTGAGKSAANHDNQQPELVTIVLVNSASYVAPDGAVFQGSELIDGKNKIKKYVFPAAKAQEYLSQRAGAMPFFRRIPTEAGAVPSDMEIVAMKGSPLTMEGKITVHHNPDARGVATGKNVHNRRLGQSGHTTIPNKEEAALTEYNRIPVATEVVSERQLGVSGHTTIPGKNEVVDENVTKSASGLHTPGEGVVRVVGESGHTTHPLKTVDGEIDTAFNKTKPNAPFKPGHIIDTTAGDIDDTQTGAVDV